MRVLGIETSCDETSAAVVEDGRHLLSLTVNSQIDIHAAYGGVVPEVAARSHIEVIQPVIKQALTQADCAWNDIDAIAVTHAPGLIGSLLVGTLTARSLSLIHDKPLYGVHHVEGHVYANFITSAAPAAQLSSALPPAAPTFPLLALIVSGGHSQLVLFQDHGDYYLLGQTQDDAVGEAFDKVAKIIGLPYPGGPSIAKRAADGDPTAYRLPKARLAGQYDFSFSGLKTAVLRSVQAACGVDHRFPSHQLADRLSSQMQADFAASFQATAIETLVDKTALAFESHRPASVVIAGGVAANLELRRQLSQRLPITVNYAPIELCTDNAAMIASLGYFRAQQLAPDDPAELQTIPSLSMSRTAWSQHRS